jgi:hypothetical protein
VNYLLTGLYQSIRPRQEDTYSPSDFVVPIVGLNDDSSCDPFLGSGVFVGEQMILVTCNHVLESWDKNYAIVIEAEEKLVSAEILKKDPKTDLALLKVGEYNPPHSLPLEDDENITLNNFVICFEYGTTITAGDKINFSPANRLGNVTRFRDITDLYNKAGDQMLELSFPALKGASGAPIMEWRPPFKLWGIVKANISAELMPAQIETLVDEKGKVEEETKFYLPQALAVHVKHVRNLISEISA